MEATVFLMHVKHGERTEQERAFPGGGGHPEGTSSGARHVWRDGDGAKTIRSAGMGKRSVKLDQINEAAVEVMGIRGFARATTQEIAELAGVSEGLLYRYYKTKAEMGLELFKRHYFDILTLLKDEAKRHEDPLERVRCVTNRYYEWFDANLGIGRFVIKTQHDFLDEVDQEEAQTLLNMMRDTLREIMGEPLHYLFPIDVFSAMILGAFLQVCTERIHGQITGPLAPKMAPITETFIVMIKRLRLAGPSSDDEEKS